MLAESFNYHSLHISGETYPLFHLQQHKVRGRRKKIWPRVLLSTSRRNITTVAEADARGGAASSEILRCSTKALGTPLFSGLVLSSPSSHLCWLVFVSQNQNITLQKNTKYYYEKKKISLLWFTRDHTKMYTLSYELFASESKTNDSTFQRWYMPKLNVNKDFPLFWPPTNCILVDNIYENRGQNRLWNLMKYTHFKMLTKKNTHFKINFSKFLY